jgi:hypothetical protein
MTWHFRQIAQYLKQFNSKIQIHEIDPNKYENFLT